jgi:hypothetical protein
LGVPWQEAGVINYLFSEEFIGAIDISADPLVLFI